MTVCPTTDNSDTVRRTSHGIDHLSTAGAWLAVICYTIQILYDFAGYSNMALGIGHMIGFTYPPNFNRPYSAISVTDFWRRWHMSLSSWFRDYLYIPLGGNRHGALRTYANLAIVFLLCGLWHGAAWTFVLWGAWHGALLVAERGFLGAWLVRLHTRVRFGLFGQYPTSQVVRGREGRTFLTSAPLPAPVFSSAFAACGYQQDGSIDNMLDGQIKRLLSLSRERCLKLLVAPSSPAVNVDQLPRWASHLCHTATPPMQRWMTQGGRGLARDVAFPLEQMRAASRETDLFPRTFFHWDGAGPRMAAEWTLRQFYGDAAGQPTPYVSHKQWLPSDIGHLFPGLKQPSEVDVIDMATSGIDICYGPGCFEHAPPVAKDLDIRRLSNARAPRRLVIISDSFGAPAAPWFARYYRDTVLFNANSLFYPKPAEPMDQVRDFVFADPANTDFIVMYHDATVYARRIGQDFSLLMPGF